MEVNSHRTSASNSIDLGEDRGLLEAGIGYEDKELEATTNFKHATRSSLQKLVCSLLLVITLSSVVVAALFGLIRAPRHEPSSNASLSNNSKSEPVEQLAIPLHPSQHATREPTTLTFDWNVTLGSGAPDGVQKQVYLINGRFPGPTIEARSGDRIVVNLHNALANESTSMHWHGLEMRGHNAMDGVIGITQCGISPGASFTYNFTIGSNEHGTFWYHSHEELQRADGLYGGLVIHKPVQEALSTVEEEDALLLIGDWFHQPQREVFEWFAGSWSMGNEPVPDSLLVNGRGRYNCSMAVPARPLICKQQGLRDMLPLLKDRKTKTKLRVVNTGTVAGVTLAIEGATMQAIAVDGNCPIDTQPSDAVGILYPGERIDVILKWKSQSTDAAWVNVYLDEENFTFPNIALNPNHTVPALPETLDTPDKQVARKLSSFSSHLDLYTVTSSSLTGDSAGFHPEEGAQPILYYAKSQLMAHLSNKPYSYINHTSWVPQQNPLLSTNRSSWDDNQLVPFIPMNPEPKSGTARSNAQPKRVTVVINNLDDGSHPFHLHGSHFYVLSRHRADGREGFGSYNPYDPHDEMPGWVNYDSPLRKDTVSVPRRGHVVLGLVADNPGIWWLHCHMLAHLGIGMAAGFHIGEAGDEGHVVAQDASAAQLCAAA